MVAGRSKKNESIGGIVKYFRGDLSEYEGVLEAGVNIFMRMR